MIKIKISIFVFELLVGGLSFETVQSCGTVAYYVQQIF